MPTPGFLASLNDEQRDAVLHDRGPLAVLAGPGSGKTRVIIHRVARLLAPGEEEGLDVAPESVLALAFTIKSANEMRERLAQMVGVSTAERVQLSTCHAFGRRIVKRFGDRLGYPWETQIADSAQRVRLLRDLIAEHALFEDRAGEGRAAVARFADERIHRFRIEGLSAARVSEWARARADALDRSEPALDETALAAERARLASFEPLARLYGLFEAACRERGWLTLDEYLTLPVRLLEERADARAILRDECRHIVVDEFQDWSPVQIRLLELLAPNSERAPPDLCVVGDDDQAIYAFRGADDRAFERFERAYPNHRRIALVRNYRSAPPILDAANRIMANAPAGSRFAPDKRLSPCAQIEDAPSRVEGIIVDDDAHLGVVIAACVREERQRRPGAPLGAFAVVARTNTDAERAASELEAAGIAAHVRRDPSPMSDPGVQDLFAWLRVLSGEQDAADEKRVLLRPPLGISPDAVRRWEDQWRRERGAGEREAFLVWLVREHAADEGVRGFVALRDALAQPAASPPACEALWSCLLGLSLADLDGLDAHERAQRIAALVAVVRFARSRQDRLAPPGDLRAFFEYIEDLDEKERSAFASPGDERVDQDDVGELPTDSVICLTAHQAKGLEFDTVFVPRVRPGWGYPFTQGRSDAEPLPESLTGRAPPDRAAEERRVFYVACTRAQRRLVLLAKAKKTRDGKSTDYYIELTSGEDAPVREGAHGRELVARGGLALPTEEEGLEDRGRGFFEGEVRRLRRQSAEAMVSVPSSGLTVERARSAAGALEDVASRLRALADLRESVAGASPGAHHEEYRRRLDAWSRRSASLYRPWPGPVRLSYSVIYDWQSCPRCCYLKHVMGLKEPAQPQLKLGHAIHATLEQYLQETRAAESEGRAIPARDRLLALGRERVHAFALSDADARDLRRQVDALLAHAHALHAESPDAQTLHVEAHVEAAYLLDGARHALVAKIDRVDQLADNRFRVIDYKTGEPAKSKLEPKPDDLQFCVYALVLPALLDPGEEGREIHADRDDDAVPFEGDAEYWMLVTGQRGVIGLSALRPGKVRAKINETIRDMLAGRYKLGPKCRGLCAIAPE